MPNGKPAGVRCINLNDENLCKIFGLVSRPKLCDQFKAELETCGENAAQAFINITLLEQQTS